MQAAGHTVTWSEFSSEISGPTDMRPTMPVYVAAEGELFPVERVEVDGAGVVLYPDMSGLESLQKRVDELTDLLQEIADSNDKGSIMSKAEIVGRAKDALR